jgi:hypothetical protein
MISALFFVIGKEMKKKDISFLAIDAQQAVFFSSIQSDKIFYLTDEKCRNNINSVLIMITNKSRPPSPIIFNKVFFFHGYKCSYMQLTI